MGSPLQSPLGSEVVGKAQPAPLPGVCRTQKDHALAGKGGEVKPTLRGRNRRGERHDYDCEESESKWHGKNLPDGLLVKGD